MENFAIRIDENVRLRLYKICRLCGDDNPNNTDILTSHKKSTNVDPDFHKKIFECVGIQVTKGDRMPQTACNTCHEKINDFHEFREMCLATDVQTRRLLGLPDTVTTKSDPAPDAEDDKTEVEKTIRKKNPAATKASLKNQKVVKAEKKALPDIKRSVKAEREKTNSRFRKKVQIQATPPETVKKKFKAEPERLAKARKRKASGDLLTEKPPNKRERHRENIIRKHRIPNIALDAEPTNVFCSICNKGFCNAGELHRHLDTDHLPRVVTFHCVGCDESIEKKQDIKNHTLWHKLSRTPYECGRCGTLVLSLGFYTKHLALCSVFIQQFEYKTKKCEACNEEFETQNLYNWHKCIINQLKCEVCQQKFSKKSAMVRHVVRCTAVSLSTSLPVVDSALEPELEPATEPEPEPEINDHFADGMSNDDASDTEMNLKPNLEIDIEVPRKERQPKVLQPSTPFVIIPSSVANTNRSERHSAAAETLTAPTPSEASSLTTIQNNDMLAANSLAKSLPMVRIKLEPIGNIIDKSCSKTNAANDCRPLNPANTSVSVRVKAEMIDSDNSGLHESNLNKQVKVEPDVEKEQQLPQSDVGNNESGTPDPLDIPSSDVLNDSPKALSPLPDQRTEERLPSTIAKPTLKLVIKKQHGTLNSSFVDDSTALRGDVEPEPKKKKKKKSKIFKIPKELAMRIKQEKLCNELYDANVTISPSIEGNEQELPLTTVNDVQSKKSVSKSHKKDAKHANINPLNPANMTLTPIRIKEEKLDDGYERSSIVANSGKEVESDLTASMRQLPDNSSSNTSFIGLNSVRIKQELVDYADKPDDFLPVRIKQELVENNPLEMPESIIPVTIKPEPIDDTDTDAAEGLSALPIISEVRSNAADEQVPDDDACQSFVSRVADVESQSTQGSELALRIANVSSGNEVLECVKNSAQHVTKSPEKSGNREPKRFPILRIKSEFSSFNFSNSASLHAESSTNRESISNDAASTQVKEEPQDIPEAPFEDNSISECMSERSIPDDANFRIKVELGESTVISNIPDEDVCGRGSEPENITSGTRVKVEPEDEVSSFAESCEDNNYACSVNRVKTERDDSDDAELNGEHANVIRSIQIKTELPSPVLIKTEEDNNVPIKNEPSDCAMSFTTESEFECPELDKGTNSSTTNINELPTNIVDVPSLLISRVESFKNIENDSVRANEEEDLLQPIKHEPFYDSFDQHPRNLFDVENSNNHFQQRGGLKLRVQSFAALRKEEEFTPGEKDKNVPSLSQSIIEDDDLFDSGTIVIKSEPSETVFPENRHQMSPNCNEVANNYDSDITSGASSRKDEDNIGVKELGAENLLNSREGDIEPIEVSKRVLQGNPKHSEKHRIDSEDAIKNQISSSAFDSDDAGLKVCEENPLFGKGDNQSACIRRNEDDENAATETENLATIKLSFESVQNKPIAEDNLKENDEEVEVKNDISEEVPNKLQTEVSPNQSTDNVTKSDTKLTHTSENKMIASPKIPLFKDDNCEKIDTEDNSSSCANNFVQHSDATILENVSLSPEDQDSIANLEEDVSVIASDCNQKLKDLIQDKDHLLGFFEDELSRNCDSVPDEFASTRNTKSPEEPNDVGQNAELLSALPSTEMSGESMNSSEKTEDANNVIIPSYATTLDERPDDALDAFRREEVEGKASVSANISGLPMANHTALLAERLVTCEDCYDAPHAKIENSPSNSPPPVKNTNFVPTTNTPLSPSTSASCNLLNPAIVPSIISLPKAIVSPSVSPSSSSYNTAHVSALSSSSAACAVRIPSVDSRSESPHNEDSTINTSSNSLNPSNEPETLFPYPNADQLESNLYSSTSQMNMLHINEIAENNNNANIERELQNDLDSISSNSNLGFEDVAGSSRNEIPEESRSLSNNGRNNNASDQ